MLALLSKDYIFTYLNVTEKGDGRAVFSTSPNVISSPGNIQSRNLDIIFLHKIDHFDSIWKSKRSRIRDILDFDTCAD